MRTVCGLSPIPMSRLLETALIHDIQEAQSRRKVIVAQIKEVHARLEAASANHASGGKLIDVQRADLELSNTCKNIIRAEKKIDAMTVFVKKTLRELGFNSQRISILLGEFDR